EELNREKNGFRIKSLRDNGFNTIKDISSATVDNIASVHGISVDAAYNIMNVVNDIVLTAREGVKIGLNVDNKTPNSTELVSFISKYRYSVPQIKNW
ncbi:MAG: hypothetical protein ACRC36_03500, partial [Lacrimispora sphenoides]